MKRKTVLSVEYNNALSNWAYFSYSGLRTVGHKGRRSIKSRLSGLPPGIRTLAANICAFVCGGMCGCFLHLCGDGGIYHRYVWVCACFSVTVRMCLSPPACTCLSMHVVVCV